MSALDSFVKVPRAPAASLQIVDNQLLVLSPSLANIAWRKYGSTLAAIRRQMDTFSTLPSVQHTLHRKYPLLHFSSYEQDERNCHAEGEKSVIVIMRGHFCYVIPRSEMIECLGKVIEIVRKVGDRHSEIKCVVLLSPIPLVRILKRLKRTSNSTQESLDEVSDLSWHSTGAVCHHRQVCLDLLNTLAWYKDKEFDHDCKVISMANVQRTKCFRITVSADNVVKTRLNRFYLPKRRTEFQQFILPIYRNQSSNYDEDVLILPGKQHIGRYIEFELLDISYWKDSVFEVLPKEDIYNEDLLLDPSCDDKKLDRIFHPIEPVVYRLELLLSPEADCDRDSTAATYDILKSSLHHSVYFRHLLDIADLLELSMGPVVSSVSATGAKVFVEVNMDLKNFTCELRPTIATNDNYEPVNKSLETVSANRLVCFEFDELAFGSVYGTVSNKFFFHRSITFSYLCQRFYSRICQEIAFSAL